MIYTYRLKRKGPHNDRLMKIYPWYHCSVWVGYLVYLPKNNTPLTALLITTLCKVVLMLLHVCQNIWLIISACRYIYAFKVFYYYISFTCFKIYLHTYLELYADHLFHTFIRQLRGLTVRSQIFRGRTLVRNVTLPVLFWFWIILKTM